MGNMETPNPTSEPTLVNETQTTALQIAEEEHEYDAVTAVLINLTLIGCLLLAYYVKRFRIYSLPESAGALLIGVLVGGVARLSTNKLVLFEFVSINRKKVCLVSTACLYVSAFFACSPRKYFSLYFYPP